MRISSPEQDASADHSAMMNHQPGPHNLLCSQTIQDASTQTPCHEILVENGGDEHEEREDEDIFIHTYSSTASYETAIIGEAHGLITDMLADSTLPPHVVSGLRAVSSLLKPPESYSQSHKPKVSPLVSLTESASYGSDSEDLPYTGERPSSLPKRLRRSLPPSLIRRMSTSTWTTTTSATGMPTLEPEPCRTRSSSFRHSRDNTPGSSPVGSRSNSPSPSSPTTISLQIPKSRSFSATSIGPLPPVPKRPQRRSLQQPMQTEQSTCSSSPIKGDKPTNLSPLVKGEAEVTEGLKVVTTPTPPVSKDATHPGLLTKRLNITSDYESNDSPSSSDHSDNVTAADDVMGPSGKGTLLKPELSVLASGESKTTDFIQSAAEKRLQDDCEEDEAAASTDGLSSSETTCSTLSVGHGHPQSVTPRPHFSLDLTKPEPSPADALSDSGVRPLVAVDHDSELPYTVEDIESNDLLAISRLSEWNYPIFDLKHRCPNTILSKVTYKLFTEVGLFETFRIPLPEFLNFFHALELGYREKPYHNRMHATDVLQAVYYLTTQPIPGFTQVNLEGDLFHKHASSSESDSDACDKSSGFYLHRPSFTAEDTYGIMGGNFPPLELMALYAAAAMHDYDHPGRTNAFLVTTHAPLAVLYNDRSVLENHHAASAWRLLLSDQRYNWICHLEKGEFKRFRFLVVEAILATDLKRHFELVAEFNAKVNDDDAPGIEWTSESDRLLVSNMVIKLADINGPTKYKDLHVRWTDRITEEFYEQGDEEARMGLPISPYMDRRHPQLAKLQESFINHLVAPLANAVATAGLIPGTWCDEDSENEDSSESDKGESSSACKDTEDEDETESDSGMPTKKPTKSRKINCLLTKNLKDNHDMWVEVIKEENAQKEREAKLHESTAVQTARTMSLSEKDIKKEMEPIKEEDTPPNSASSTVRDEAGCSRVLDSNLPDPTPSTATSSSMGASPNRVTASTVPPQTSLACSQSQSSSSSAPSHSQLSDLRSASQSNHPAVAASQSSQKGVGPT